MKIILKFALHAAPLVFLDQNLNTTLWNFFFFLSIKRKFKRLLSNLDGFNLIFI